MACGLFILAVHLSKLFHIINNRLTHMDSLFDAHKVHEHILWMGPIFLKKNYSSVPNFLS
jgi:hypothetical protein